MRFKAQGLEAIEVQDNGTGISKENFAGLGRLHGAMTVHGVLTRRRKR